MDVAEELTQRFPDVPFTPQITKDGIPTVWAPRENLLTALEYLKGA